MVWSFMVMTVSVEWGHLCTSLTLVLLSPAGLGLMETWGLADTPGGDEAVFLRPPERRTMQ
jgi:hypothetical protein